MAESRATKIDLPNTPTHVLRQVLHYIYSDKLVPITTTTTTPTTTTTMTTTTPTTTTTTTTPISVNEPAPSSSSSTDDEEEGDFDVNFALDLLGVADEFQIDRLKRLCSKIIERGVDDSNVLFVFQVANTFRAARWNDDNDDDDADNDNDNDNPNIC
eukprot:TRINITY_DN14399_c0_g1_i1.p1 TRINITY_DN14399_c0_g1~~TRINITY_DN14399_c0_g1_i1.p1  ORF type:complete len:157 (-),score=39.05 TRINITY_DN14399_c0_g1_i1:236-706(-)